MFSNINDKKANGVSKINIFTIIYLNEYVKTKFKSEVEIVAFIIPSREKIFNVELLSEENLFISEINSEKQIFLLNKFSPILLIAKVIFDVKFNNSLIKKYE